MHWWFSIHSDIDILSKALFQLLFDIDIHEVHCIKQYNIIPKHGENNQFRGNYNKYFKISRY